MLKINRMTIKGRAKTYENEIWKEGICEKKIKRWK